MSEEKKQKNNGTKKAISEDSKIHAQEEAVVKEQAKSTSQQIPEASFSLFISSLATQSLINLGDMENPINKKMAQNLDQAKFTINTLQIIRDKTEGNLTDEESKNLDTLVYDLKMRYAEKRR